ncbi:hypothetical protein ACLSYX_04095 [[Pasteurella] aerogenes]
MEITIQLSKSFQKGSLNTLFFKDIPFMTDDELRLLFDFMQQVSSKKRLRGKNKPSWQDDNLDIIPGTDKYQQNNIWHYHCGPYADTAILNLMGELKLNLNGETSGPVIHYQKVTDNHILILAFSPLHEPFPREQDSSNPLIERSK